MKKIKYCLLCDLDTTVNKKPCHHVIPRKLKKKSNTRVWLCRACHMIIHKAEQKGICKLPSSDEEYKKWKLAGDKLK